MLGDGAIGTLLYQRGEPLDACYDALNLSHPETVRRIHRDYLDAGAVLIETNTFGANRVQLEKFRLAERVQDINRRGAEIALALAHPRGAFVAGSVGPLTVNPSVMLADTQRAEAYQEQMQALIEGGVDALFLETFPRLSELLLALKAASALPRTALLASLSFGDDGHTADGVRIAEAFSQLRAAGADIVGLNCHFGPANAESLLREVEVRADDLISVYPNAGRPQYIEGRYIYHPTPQYFADFTPKLVAQGARLIGGCCGTTPETISAMAKVIQALRPVTAKRASVTITEQKPRVQGGEPLKTLLDLARERKLIVTELDPPKSLGLEKLIEGAAQLKKAGTDFVTLADNSLAILRVSNLAAGFMVRQKANADVIIHLACRDHNLIGLQSLLMGMHALGINHVLALTGDPAKIGDHPAASNVYDVNSIGLIRTIKQINNGFAANGRDLKSRAQFIVGCAFNPNARNIDNQVKKLEDKIKAGADFVMTQPIFDPALAKLTHERTRQLGLPVFVGVMPLLHARNAEFLHNEVPGISIPDSVRERLRQAGDQGNAEGLRIARELTGTILENFPGIYFITPLMRFDLTVELSRYVREQTAAPQAPVIQGSRA